MSIAEPIGSRRIHSIDGSQEEFAVTHAVYPQQFHPRGHTNAAKAASGR
jgi:hypothetical protein